jgi:hypothetical protein
MKYLMLLFIFFLVMGFASASIDYLGSFKQNTCIQLPQGCSDCTYNNISSVLTPLGEYSVRGNYAMTQNNQSYNYTFCNTKQLGLYSVAGHGNVNGTDTPFSYTFDITPSGFIGTLGFYIILISIVALVIILGFSINEEWFVIIGGMGSVMLGLYSINYGIAGFRDMFMTWGVGLFEVAVGSILSIGSGFQKIES